MAPLPACCAALAPIRRSSSNFQSGSRTRLTPEELQRKPLTYENAVAIRRALPVGGTRQPVSVPAGGFGRQSDSARYKGNDLYQIQLGGTEESYTAGGRRR